MIRSVVALFGAGVASFLAPCVLPLVPAYVGMMAGASAVGTVPATVGAPSGIHGAVVPTPRTSRPPPEARLLPSALSFVAGFSAVFVAFGLAAGALGASYERARGAVQLVGGVAVVVFGLVLLGVARGPLARTARLGRATLPGGRAGGPVGAAVMGITFGAAWTPCVGPLLGAALVAATRAGSAGRGGVLLAAYAAGLGVPFVFVALGLDAFPAVSQRLLRAGRRSGVVLQHVGGVGLVALGALLITGRYSTLVSALARWRR